MMSLGGLGSLGFTAPFVLLGLLSLPALWFLVRALPPQPRSEQFPPMVLLGDLINSEPPPARTPLWLLILRFLLGALLFLALSGPVLNPIEETPGDGPVLLVVDNGWEAASRWDDRIALLDRLLNTMARENRPVVLLPTAPPPNGWRSGEDAAKPQPQAASDMRRSLMGFAPVPWSPDLQQTTEIVTQLDHDFARIFWISDGLAHPRSDDLWSALNAMGTVTLYADGAADYPVALLPLVQTGLDYSLTVVRPPRQAPARFVVQALGSDGRRLGEADAVFGEWAQTAQARIDLPRDLRNQVARIDIANGKSAGTVALLDARSGRPLVALSAGEASSAIQPLKSPLFYLRRALEPYAELTDGAPATLLDQSPSAIILADVGRMAEPAQRRLGAWVEEGGLLIRFAGPRMAAGGDDLIPVRLRSGDRAVGGALSWEEPQPLGPFNPDGPFAGLTPPETVRVSRQLLAVPDINLADRTWARLLDGTPLVTANRRGNGWIVLFHTSANADWSSLALSGLFVDMLKRLLPLAQHRAGADQQHNGPEFLANRTVMDGFGRLGPANTDIAPISRSAFDRTSASAAHPPGYYGLAANPLALSLMSANGPITAEYQFLESSRPAMDIATGSRTDRALAPLLFALMVALVALDMIASLWMRGLFNRPLTALRRAVTPAVILISGGALFLAALPGTGHAQSTERLETGFALEATAATRIAYIRTGNARSTPDPMPPFMA
ncbi:hypothetical protein JCM17843_16600 [Kordiimonadales bacterium JCM 17843]|nr:hypothetical protein JCM17843_16600 [Kordiimonadales bacterium JCM 17843]